jgi:hypothetical protein
LQLDDHERLVALRRERCRSGLVAAVHRLQRYDERQRSKQKCNPHETIERLKGE